DAAVVAVPLGVLPETVAAVLGHAPPGCVVTDVGSTKRAVVAANGDERFVGGHPLAGSEAAGVAHAREDLFDGAVSHLPHVVANVLVAQATRALGGERIPPTGPSFRDATRVAGANPALWTDIYLGNRDALLQAIDDTLARLTAARDAL